VNDLDKVVRPINWESFRSDGSGASSVRILVVDDNEALRYSVTRTLQEAGYQTLEAATGAEGLRLCAESPDLILLDVNLPDMSGFQVCRQVKSSPSTSHIPVLHISSTFVDAEYRVKGLEGGADAYLTEPVDRAELIASVNALLRLKHAETVARQQAQRATTALAQLAELNSTLERRIAERTDELTFANDSLSELSAELLKIQDEERRRIARELHDSVGQSLAAVKMNNSMVLRESQQLSVRAAEAATQINALTDEVIRNIRTISHLLHPPLLDEMGLAAALNWYVQEFSARSGIGVTFDGSTQIERLTPEAETNIFRIVQECLGNVHRHSHCSAAKVIINAGRDGILLTVADNGVGISPSRLQELQRGVRSGMGLRSMRERIAPFGGELTISSQGQGTMVTVALPHNRKVRRTSASPSSDSHPTG
jgi:signal transduction histidine kinase